MTRGKILCPDHLRLDDIKPDHRAAFFHSRRRHRRRERRMVRHPQIALEPDQLQLCARGHLRARCASFSIPQPVRRNPFLQNCDRIKNRITRIYPLPIDAHHQTLFSRHLSSVEVYGMQSHYPRRFLVFSCLGQKPNLVTITRHTDIPPFGPIISIISYADADVRTPFSAT